MGFDPWVGKMPAPNPLHSCWQVSISVFHFKIIYLFIFGCTVSSLLRGLFLIVPSGGSSSLHCMGFSLHWRLLWSMGSRHSGFSSCGSPDLKHRLSSGGAQAQLLRGTRDLPRPGIEPVSPTQAGRFLSTVPPGKSLQFSYVLSEDCFCFLFFFNNSG